MDFDLVCVDGSFNEAAGRAGMGWVIVQDRKISELSASLKTGDIRRNNSFAEFMAAALGLGDLNARSTKPSIKLITDNEQVYKFAINNASEREAFISSLEDSWFKESVIELHNAINDTQMLDVILITPKKLKKGPLRMIANMSHNAACMGSGAGSTKEVNFTKPITKSRPVRKDPIIPLHTRSSSLDANVVIDPDEDSEPDQGSGPMPILG